MPRERAHLLNVDMWNNRRVASLSGYTIEMLKPCLLAIIDFMQQNLHPNKLKYFKFDNLQNIKNKLSSLD